MELLSITINCFQFNKVRETNTGDLWKLSLASTLGRSAASFSGCCCQNPSKPKFFRDQLCKPWPRRPLPPLCTGDQLRSREPARVLISCGAGRSPLLPGPRCALPLAHGLRRGPCAGFPFFCRAQNRSFTHAKQITHALCSGLDSLY